MKNSSNKKHIIFTGGGSGGHVMPAKTIIDSLNREEFHISYFGEKNGIERKMISPIGITYYSIHTGKLRRYFSLQNFFDFFKFLLGLFEATFILLKHFPRNALIFSTGGFVSLPLVLAAFCTRRTIFIHEQTSCAGLANRIAAKVATLVFTTFESSKIYFPKKKIRLIGYPLRKECLDKAIQSSYLTGINLKNLGRPILFVTGGGNGSSLMNNLVLANLEELTEKYFVIHQTGEKHLPRFTEFDNPNYLPLGLIGKEMIDLYKLSSVIICRSGAGTVAELLALNIRAIYIPLKIAQKNEQYFNAKEAQKANGSLIVTEDEVKNLNLAEFLDNFLNSPPPLKSNSSQGELFKLSLSLLIEEIKNHYEAFKKIP